MEVYAYLFQRERYQKRADVDIYEVCKKGYYIKSEL